MKTAAKPRDGTDRSPNSNGVLLVLGLGNTLLRDEGAGVHLGRLLAQAPQLLPPNTEVADGGTLGIELLPRVADARALLILDAANLHATAGTVRVLRGSELNAVFGGHISAHQAGAGDLIAVAALTGALPTAVAMVAIQPGDITFDLALSPAVERAVRCAVALARSTAWDLHQEAG